MHTRSYHDLALPIDRSDEEVSERAARAIELIREALSLLSAAEVDPRSFQTANDRLIKLPDIERLTGLRRSAIYERMRRGAFPKSVKVGVRSATWSHAAVQAWISARVAGRTDD